VKHYYLCAASSEIQKELDGFFVRCTGLCGPYIITPIALDDLIKIHGRKQGVIDRPKMLRQQDQERRIRISHDSVSFVPKLRSSGEGVDEPV